MNKFYNPALYVAPPRRELTEEERIYVNSGGAGPGVTVFAQLRTTMRSKDAPAPPPETVDAYTKKDSSGPVALIEKLKHDLEKEMQASELDEKQSQKDYEEMMADSANQR